MKDFVRYFFFCHFRYFRHRLCRICYAMAGEDVGGYAGPSNRCRRSCSSLYSLFILFVGAHRINVVAECHAYLHQPHLPLMMLLVRILYTLFFVVGYDGRASTHRTKKKRKEKLVNILKWILCYPAGVPTVFVRNFLVYFLSLSFSLSIFYDMSLWRTFVFQRELPRVSNC